MSSGRAGGFEGKIFLLHEGRQRRFGGGGGADECGPDELALQRVSGGERFRDERVPWRRIAFGGLMPLGVEEFAGRGCERDEAHAAGGIATGVLEMRQLVNEFLLARTYRTRVQGVNVIEDVDENLQPVALGPAQFLDFQPQGGFLGVVGFRHELGEVASLGGHAFGDFAGGDGGFLGLSLDGFPLGRGAGNLGGQLFEVGDFFRNAAQREGVELLHERAMIEQVGQDGEQRAERHAEGTGAEFPVAERPAGFKVDEVGEAEHGGIAEEKRPFGQANWSSSVHRKQV